MEIILRIFTLLSGLACIAGLQLWRRGALQALFLVFPGLLILDLGSSSAALPAVLLLTFLLGMPFIAGRELYENSEVTRWETIWDIGFAAVVVITWMFCGVGRLLDSVPLLPGDSNRPGGELASLGRELGDHQEGTIFLVFCLFAIAGTAFKAVFGGTRKV